MKTISIAIIDDDKLIVELLKNYLNNHKEYHIIYTACDGEEFISALTATPSVIPNILILGLKFKQMNGIDVVKHMKIHYPEIKIIVISSYYHNSFLGFVFKTGAAAFISKRITPQHLKEIINIVEAQGIYFMKEQVDLFRTQISAKAPQPTPHRGSTLSRREVEILKLICSEKTAKEIGEILFISQKTVEGHKNSLFSKTQTKNIAGLVVYAIKNKILNINDFPTP